MLEIRGKRGRPVPALLRMDVVDAITLLIESRSEASIDPDNTYLFPCSTGINHIQGHQCLRRFTLDCNLEFAERIASTSLRKYTATFVQNRSYRDSETKGNVEE